MNTGIFKDWGGSSTSEMCRNGHRFQAGGWVQASSKIGKVRLRVKCVEIVTGSEPGMSTGIFKDWGGPSTSLTYRKHIYAKSPWVFSLVLPLVVENCLCEGPHETFLFWTRRSHSLSCPWSPIAIVSNAVKRAARTSLCRTKDRQQRCFLPSKTNKQKKNRRIIEELFSQRTRPERASREQRTDGDETSQICGNSHIGGRAVINA